MEGDVPVIGRPDERLRLLDEEMWQADLRSRSVVVPSMKLSAEQQRLHDEKLTPLKLIKDTAQRRHMVCERYAELLRLALVQNWSDPQLEEEKAKALAEFRELCQGAVADWLDARVVDDGQRVAIASLLAEEMDHWPDLIRTGETRDGALARLTLSLRLEQMLFDVVEREHIAQNMKYAVNDEEGKNTVEKSDRAHQKALEMYDMSELGRAKVGDAKTIKNMLAAAGKNGADAERKWAEELRKPVGLSVIHMAAHHGRAGLVEFILQRVPSCATLMDEQGYSPLFHALTARSMGHAETARVLLGVPGVTTQRCRGMTVLVWAARNNNVEAVRALLLAAPQLVNVPEEKSLSTPLHYACHRGFLSTVNQLLAAGADVKMRDAGGLTPLLKALSTTSPPQDSLKGIYYLLNEYSSPIPTPAEANEHRRKFAQNPDKLGQLDLVLQIFHH